MFEQWTSAAAVSPQGELPTMTKGFWRSLLRRSLAPDLFSSLEYGVFGLGDSGG